MSRSFLQRKSQVQFSAVALAATMLVSHEAPAAVLNLSPNSGYVVTVEVNGHPLRLRVDPGGFSEVTLNRSAAERANLHRSSSSLIGMIGPIRLQGRAARARLSVAGNSSRARFIWFDQEVLGGVDGVISPALLPYAQVNFTLPGQGAVGRTAVLPVRFHSQLGIMHDLAVGSERVSVRFSLVEPQTTATAAAGAIIAAQQVVLGPPRQRPIACGSALSGRFA